MLGSAWRHVTIALEEMFSMVVPPSPRQNSDKAHRRQAASVVLTAILVAVVIALSCGICGVVALLYRRQYYNHRADRGHVYGLNCNDGEDDDDDDDADISEGKIIVGQRQKHEVVQPVVGVGGPRQQHQQQRTPLPTRSSRRTEYAVDGDVSGNAEVSAPLLQLQRPAVQRLPRAEESKGQLPSAFLSATMRRHGGTDSADAVMTVKNNTTVVNRDSGTGPDIVMSTAATSTPANAGK